MPHLQSRSKNKKSLKFRNSYGIKFDYVDQTYPKWKITAHDGIYKTSIEMFNSRTDVEWYEISVFDNDWKQIRFVTEQIY